MTILAQPQPLVRPTKSEIFTVYNVLRAFARKYPHLIDPGRVNKALGLLQSNAYWTEKRVEYSPTPEHCYCKDYEYSYARRRKHAQGGRYQGPCKHQITERLFVDIADRRQTHDVTHLVEQREEKHVLESDYRVRS